MARVYQTFYRLPISINLLRFSCGYTSHTLLARQLSALLCLSGKSKKQQQKRSKTAAPWPLSPLRHPALHRGIDARGIFGPHVVQALASPPPSWGSATPAMKQR